MDLDVAEIGKVLGVGVAVAVVLIAAAIAAVKTLRQDAHIEQLVDTMQEALDATKADRDYWKNEALEGRQELERRFNARLDNIRAEAALGREALYGVIEGLRQEMQGRMELPPQEDR